MLRQMRWTGIFKTSKNLLEVDCLRCPDTVKSAYSKEACTVFLNSQVAW